MMVCKNKKWHAYAYDSVILDTKQVVGENLFFSWAIEIVLVYCMSVPGLTLLTCHGLTWNMSDNGWHSSAG